MTVISVLLILSCLWLLASSRLHVAIRVVAIQGVLLGVLPMVRSGEYWLGRRASGTDHDPLQEHPAAVADQYVFAAFRAAAQIEPFIGFGPSLLCGTALLGLAVWITDRLQLT